MLMKKLIKKAAILGMSFGLVASPMAFAHSSIELNKDSSVDRELIKPTSKHTSGSAQYSTSDLTHDEGSSLDYSASSSRHSDSTDQRADRDEGYSASDLTRDEGDDLRW